MLILSLPHLSDQTTHFLLNFSFQWRVSSFSIVHSRHLESLLSLLSSSIWKIPSITQPWSCCFFYFVVYSLYPRPLLFQLLVIAHLGFCGAYNQSEWPAVTQLFKSLLISSWSSRVSPVFLTWENMPSVSCVPDSIAPPLTTSVFSPSADAKLEYFMSCRSARLSLTLLQDYLFSLPEMLLHSQCARWTLNPPSRVSSNISVPWPVHLFMYVWSMVFLACLPLRAGTLPAQLGRGSCTRLSIGGL